MMTNQDVQPYDFSPLDDMYLSADEYEVTSNTICAQIQAIEEDAWAAIETQSLGNKEEYIRAYIVAQWRTLESEYAQSATIRRSRVLPFRQAIMLFVLLAKDELSDDFLEAIEGFTRDEILTKVSEASMPWLDRYNVCLAYSTEIEYEVIEWQVFIGPRPE